MIDSRVHSEVSAIEIRLETDGIEDVKRSQPDKRAEADRQRNTDIQAA